MNKQKFFEQNEATVRTAINLKGKLANVNGHSPRAIGRD